MVDPEINLPVIQADVSLLVEAAGDPDRPVPSCPGWTVGRLLRHLGKVQRWALACVEADGDEDLPPPPGPGEGVDPTEWFAEGAARLLTALRTADLDDPAHTWAGRRTNGWWLRRITHETAIHRWDAQGAVGTPDPVPVPVAVDGVDEVLEEVVPVLAAKRLAGPQRSLHLHATDTPEGEWYVAFGDDGLAWEHDHRKGDVALRGPASDLFLAMWGRVGAEAFEIHGDPEVLARWQAAIRV